MQRFIGTGSLTLLSKRSDSKTTDLTISYITISYHIMKRYCAIWACGLALVQATLAGEASRALVEQRTQSFTIGLNGSVADVTPLFGPVREAEWAPDWSPRFIHPSQGAQQIPLSVPAAHPWHSVVQEQ